MESTGPEGTPLDLAPSSQCPLSCPGDQSQKCGGPDSVTVLTAECEAGWTRFGAKCLKEVVPTTPEVKVREALQTCVTEGGNLYFPDSLEEFQFVTKTFWSRSGCSSSDHCHLFLGIKHYQKDFGLLASDNSHHVGFKGFSREY